MQPAFLLVIFKTNSVIYRKGKRFYVTTVTVN